MRWQRSGRVVDIASRPRGKVVVVVIVNTIATLFGYGLRMLIRQGGGC
jgi:hypothetical protein